jgi:hypothetical protein
MTKRGEKIHRPSFPPPPTPILDFRISLFSGPRIYTSRPNMFAKRQSRINCPTIHFSYINLCSEIQPCSWCQYKKMTSFIGSICQSSKIDYHHNSPEQGIYLNFTINSMNYLFSKHKSWVRFQFLNISWVRFPFLNIFMGSIPI